MKTYKLIKEYPDSPKLGYVCNSQTFESGYLNHDNLSNHPEFWEEVVEKDYEILSFKDAINSILSKNINGKFNSFSIIAFTEQELIDNKCKIHSIKRLSDGEIFTVGDKIKHKNDVKYPNGKLTKMEIIGDSLFFESNHNYQGFNTNMYFIEKVKQPLFTTEDRVDIFEGDEVTFVNKENFKVSTTLTTNIRQQNRVWDGSDGFLQFSTKEKAEDYILLNKPCLSLQDLIDIKICFKSNSILTRLKELTKLKLNR